MIIASPQPAGITRFPDLARKRLGVVAHRDADRAVPNSLIAYYGLTLLNEAPAGPIPADAVLLVQTEPADLTAALTAKTIDAVVAILAPAAPAAQAIVASARLPIHRGAIDDYEREQRSFLDRDQDWVYILASVGGGLGSGLARLSQRLARTRRERIDEVLDRLIEILDTARTATTEAALDGLAAETDALSADVRRYARDNGTDTRGIGTLTPAIDSARKAVADARVRVSGETQPAIRAAE